jgi:TatD DNase family protein
VSVLVDSHCHLDLLDYEKLETDVEHIVSTASQNDIGYMLCVCIDWEQFPSMLALTRKFANVYASVGVHPNHDEGHEPSVDELVKAAEDDKIIAIGETGLDYFRSEGDLDWQRDRFRRHIAAAKESNKPLIIHSREAREDTLRILAEEKAADIGGVMHCFAEDWETAQRAMEMNFYISFSGIVTFKSAATLKDVAKRVPLDRMLVETDSPYLAPVPFRGKTNQPAYVKQVAEHIAELRNTDYETIASASTENFFNLFKYAKLAA